MSEDLKKAVAKRLAQKEAEGKEKLDVAVKKRMEELERTRPYTMTDQGLVALKPGVFTLPGSDLLFRLDEREIPNLQKLIEKGQIKVAGKRSGRSRKTKNKKNGSTRRRK
jgi:hypothetical protein